MSLRKIFFAEFMFAFIFLRLSVIFTLLAASISHFLTAAMKFPCVSPNEIRLLCFESLFFCNPQITEGVNVEKDTTFLVFFLSLKVQMAMRFPSKQTLELHLGAIPVD